MKNFTKLFMAVLFLSFSTDLLAQIPNNLVKNKISAQELYNGKPKAHELTRAAQSYVVFLDYGTANGDDAGYIWSFNSLYTGIDTALNYVAVSLDAIAGFDETGATVGIGEYGLVGLPDAYPENLLITIDSIFVQMTHENNSGLTDSVIIQLVNTTGTGAPGNTVLWQQAFATDTSLSSNGNWLGTGASFILDVNPAFTSTTPGAKYAVNIKYIDPSKQDSFGVAASYVDNGSGGTDNPSYYENSYMRYPPFISSVAKCANIGYGTPVGADGWYEAQNWTVFAKTSYDWDVRVNDVNNNLTFTSFYPNPTKDELRVNLDLKNASDVTITISDVTGRIVSSVFNGNMNAGNNKITTSTVDLSNGIYFINANTSNGNVVSAKFVVAK